MTDPYSYQVHLGSIVNSPVPLTPQQQAAAALERLNEALEEEGLEEFATRAKSETLDSGPDTPDEPPAATPYVSRNPNAWPSSYALGTPEQRAEALGRSDFHRVQRGKPTIRSSSPPLRTPAEKRAYQEGLKTGYFKVQPIDGGDEELVQRGYLIRAQPDRRTPFRCPEDQGGCGQVFLAEPDSTGQVECDHCDQRFSPALLPDTRLTISDAEYFRQFDLQNEADALGVSVALDLGTMRYASRLEQDASVPPRGLFDSRLEALEDAVAHWGPGDAATGEG